MPPFSGGREGFGLSLFWSWRAGVGFTPSRSWRGSALGPVLEQERKRGLSPPGAVAEVWNVSLLGLYIRCGLWPIPELEGRHGSGHVLQQRGCVG